MKNSILLCLLFFSFKSVIGQFAITVENTPEPDYLYVLKLVDLEHQIAITDGENVIWDFQAMTHLDDSTSTFYTKESAYPSFPDHDFHDPVNPSDTGLIFSDNAIYGLTDTSFVQKYGIRGVFGPYGYVQSVYAVDWVKLKFPFEFGDYLEVGSTNCGSYTQSSSSIELDAFGTILFPDTTIDNVVRVHTTYSCDNPGTVHDNPVIKNTYDWYSVDSEVPLLTYAVKQVGNLITGNTYISAYLFDGKYYTPYITSGNQEISSRNNIKIYPQPASDIVHILTDEKVDYIRLYNSKAASIPVEYSLKGNEVVIDSSNLQNGIYIVCTYFNNGALTTEKMIINR